MLGRRLLELADPAPPRRAPPALRRDRDGIAVAVTQAPPNPNQAVSETTSGASKQHHGVARDPFTPLPEAKASVRERLQRPRLIGLQLLRARASSSLGIRQSSSSSGGTTPTPSRNRTPGQAEDHVHYHVTVLFGVVPDAGRRRARAARAAEALRGHALTNRCPPSEPLLVFLGVSAQRQGRAVHAHRRGDPARPALPAERDAVPGDRAQARPEREARIRRPTGGTVTYELSSSASPRP